MGNACGAIVVSRHGCAPAMPTWAELQSVLRTAGELARGIVHPPFGSCALGIDASTRLS